MAQPRDVSPATTVGLVRIVRVFSTAVSPPAIFAALALALALYELSLWTALMWAAVFGFWVSLAPVLLIFYLLRTGQISDLHMSSPGERHLPYISSVVGASIALIFMTQFGGPPLLTCLSAFSLVILAVLGLINSVWLISIHASSIVASAVIVLQVFGVGASLFIWPVVALVCWARLYLRRHTFSQVAAGAMLGASMVIAANLLGCFQNAS